MNKLKQQEKVETCSNQCTFCWGDTVIKNGDKFCEECQVKVGDFHELI